MKVRDVMTRAVVSVDPGESVEVAARTLAHYNIGALAAMLGIDPDHINATAAGLALGASGPSVIELATAFGAIANSGTYQESYVCL